jgi:hypothetical protein
VAEQPCSGQHSLLGGVLTSVYRQLSRHLATTHVVRGVTLVRTKDWKKSEVIHLTMDQSPQHDEKYFARESHRRLSGWSHLTRLQGGAGVLQAEDRRPSHELGK